MSTAITNENFETIVNQSKIPVLIDAYATWCGPCQQMKPIFSSLEKEYEGQCLFVSLNIDQARDISIMLNVTSVPTFIFYNKGKMISKETGYMSKESLKSHIDDFLLTI